ncbi:hypothetical protein V6N11_055879 [Hibiscus sabdariffa]|uniref:Uncharacterized protein n=1 Tax=Hibiscus sabdariffa TaxID=183260 RepID=A0ABR2T302_9ROSI
MANGKFRNALVDSSLKDLGYSGQWFTWKWGRTAANNIGERLVRGTTTSPWEDLFPNHRVEHLPDSFFDHFHIMITSDSNQTGSKRVWHFKFEAS